MARESSSKFYYVENVSAAAGIKISGSGLDDALPGSPVLSTDYPNYEDEIKTEMKEVFTTDKSGVILKADTIGSIEALSRLLKDISVNVSKKEVGSVTKRDILDAFAMRAVDPYSSIVVAFNTKIEDEARLESSATGVRILESNIIYKILDDYKEWYDSEKKMEKQTLEKALTFPGSVRLLPNSCFRMSHPAVFGVEVIEGRIRTNVQLMNERGEIIGKIKQMQDNGISMQEAKKGMSIAISIEDITYGRQVKENDVLYVFLSDDNERALRYKFANMLNEGETDLLEKISIVKSKMSNK